MSSSRNAVHYLDAALYERIIDGPSPVLSEAEIADANSGDGLNLIVLNFGLRDHDLSNMVTQQVLRLGNAAFYALHAGYRMKTIVNEVFRRRRCAIHAGGGIPPPGYRARQRRQRRQHAAPVRAAA
jgi:hypothetical protein